MYDGYQAKVSEEETKLSYIQNGKALVIADIKKQEQMSVKLQEFISWNHRSALNVSDSQENGQNGKSTNPVVCLRVPAVSHKLLFHPYGSSGDTGLGNAHWEPGSRRHSKLMFWG